MAQWLDSIGGWMVNTAAGQCVAYLVAFTLGSVAVALVDETCKRMTQTRLQAKIDELEYLFRLPDLRSCSRHR